MFRDMLLMFLELHSIQLDNFYYEKTHGVK